MDNFTVQRQQYAQIIEAELARLLDGPALPQERLRQAMRYSLLGGGKRVRGMLTLAFGQLLGAPQPQALACACAVEMVHCYSLIHDDLPCMDDDDLRRGKPSCHRQFDEATAVLAGDSLLTLAFAELARALPAEKCAAAVACLADAAGYLGMTGGQMLDISAGGALTSAEALERIDACKTGALIRAAARLGCIAAGAEEKYSLAADGYAEKIGLSFQVVDDILDAKLPAKGASPVVPEGEPSYVALCGLEGSRALCARLTGQAVAYLCIFGPEADFLRAFALYLQNRAI